MSDISINYKGSSIATMDASGTKTLLTEGKYCEDDIEVVYTKPASPTGTKQLTITANGTTTEDVTNYANAEITANVPNTYAAADEGKVVSNGALVSQSSDTATQNGTVDTTLINSLTVNVSGGGGPVYTKYSGSYTIAAQTRYWAVTGLNAPAAIVKYTIAENAYDGTTKMLAGVYVDGFYMSMRTTTGGTSRAAEAYPPVNQSSFTGRTVQPDGTNPGAAIVPTTTGFVIGSPSGTYSFPAGYTYIWECWTLPEDNT